MVDVVLRSTKAVRFLSGWRYLPRLPEWGLYRQAWFLVPPSLPRFLFHYFHYMIVQFRVLFGM
jgi:hypothetical protein